jgi:hypothetical protein
MLADPASRIAGRVTEARRRRRDVSGSSRRSIASSGGFRRCAVHPAGRIHGRAPAHLARTVCRRAATARVGSADAADPALSLYLNRLSDLLFVMARAVNHVRACRRPSGEARMNSIVVHYQELALKGKNRPWFLSRLVRNLRRAMSDLDVRDVRVLMGRIEVVLGPGAARAGRRARSAGPSASRTSRTRGVCRSDLDRRRRHPRRSADRAACAASACRRGAPTSVPADVAADRARGWRPNQEARRLERRTSTSRSSTIHLELLTNEAFYYFGKERGPAACQRHRRPRGVPALRRHRLPGGGAPDDEARLLVTFGHFHSYPILSRRRRRRRVELVRLLTGWQQQSRLYLVAFGDIQQQVVLSVRARCAW